MKYRCIEPFEVDCYTGDGMLIEGRIEITRGSNWERDNDTNIIGTGIHLDNKETMEWLEIPKEDLEKYFEPINGDLEK